MKVSGTLKKIMDKLLEEMRTSLLEAEDKGYEFDTTDWHWQIGYLMSWSDLSKLLIYIEGLKKKTQVGNEL